jgi:hypothetical protein
LRKPRASARKSSQLEIARCKRAKFPVCGATVVREEFRTHWMVEGLFAMK